MRNETRSWMAKADRDLGTAVFAMQSVDGPLPVTTGLHCQSSAENFLRAYLQEYKVAFSEGQNLMALFEASISIDRSFVSLRGDMNQLAGYSIASRYPKASEVLEFNETAIAAVNRVREFIIGKIN